MKYLILLVVLLCGCNRATPETEQVKRIHVGTNTDSNVITYLLLQGYEIVYPPRTIYITATLEPDSIAYVSVFTTIFVAGHVEADVDTFIPWTYYSPPFTSPMLMSPAEVLDE